MIVPLTHHDKVVCIAWMVILCIAEIAIAFAAKHYSDRKDK